MPSRILFTQKSNMKLTVIFRIVLYLFQRMSSFSSYVFDISMSTTPLTRARVITINPIILSGLILIFHVWSTRKFCPCFFYLQNVKKNLRSKLLECLHFLPIILFISNRTKGQLLWNERKSCWVFKENITLTPDMLMQFSWKIKGN